MEYWSTNYGFVPIFDEKSPTGGVLWWLLLLPYVDRPGWLLLFSSYSTNVFFLLETARKAREPRGEVHSFSIGPVFRLSNDGSFFFCSRLIFRVWSPTVDPFSLLDTMTAMILSTGTWEQHQPHQNPCHTDRERAQERNQR
jgi:hypothetical protein